MLSLWGDFFLQKILTDVVSANFYTTPLSCQVTPVPSTEKPLPPVVPKVSCDSQDSELRVGEP